MGIQVLKTSCGIVAIFKMGVVGVHKMRNPGRTRVEQGLHLERKGIRSRCNPLLHEPPDLAKDKRGAPECQPEFFSALCDVFAVEQYGCDAVDQDQIRPSPDQAGYIDRIHFMIRELFLEYPLNDAIGERPCFRSNESNTLLFIHQISCFSPFLTIKVYDLFIVHYVKRTSSRMITGVLRCCLK